MCNPSKLCRSKYTNWTAIATTKHSTADSIPNEIVASPVNTFQQQQLEEHAFPVLYPKGRFGLGYLRTKHITDLKYFQTRLFNKDSRWWDNVVWLFWAFEMRIVSHINHQYLTAGNINNPDNDSLSRSYMFMGNIRGTAAYWKDQLLDLLARINTIGSPKFS